MSLPEWDISLEKNKSDIILEELKRRRGEERVVDVEEATVKLVIFSLLSDYYAFYGSDVKEILPLLDTYYVPGSPHFIVGVVNVRGDIESVISINTFLGLKDGSKTPQGRIILASGEGIRSGILVDSIVDVVDVPVSGISPPLPTLDKTGKELVAGEIHYRDRNVTLLDLARIFRKIPV